MKYNILIYANGDKVSGMDLELLDNGLAWSVIRGIIDDTLECYYGEQSTLIRIKTDSGEFFLKREMTPDDESDWLLCVNNVWMPEEAGSRWDECLSGWL